MYDQNVKYTEVVVHPPTFRLQGAGSRDGKVWNGSLCVDTPKGPLTMDMRVTLPVAIGFIADRVCSYLSEQVAARMVAQNGGGQAAEKVIGSVQANVQAAALDTITRSTHHFPPSYKAEVHKAVNSLTSARTPAAYQSALTSAARNLGTSQIPGTQIPLAALSSFGARSLAVGGLINRGVSAKAAGMMPGTASVHDQVMREQYGMDAAGAGGTGMLTAFRDAAGAIVQGIARDPRAIDQIALELLHADANEAGAELANMPGLLKQYGVPTMLVPEGMQGLAGDTVKLLLAAGQRDPAAIAKIVELGKVAAGGNTQAVQAWMLAAQIGDAANAQIQKLMGSVPGMASLSPAPLLGMFGGLPGLSLLTARGDTAGDGAGNGYGVPGYTPPPSPSRLLLSS